MSKQQRAAIKMNQVKVRSRAAWIAVIGWWSAFVLMVIAGIGLNAWLADESKTVAQRIGIWCAGFAVLAGLTGWVGSIGSVVKDHGRIRVGAICLAAVPLFTIVLAIIGMSSTVINPGDMLSLIWGLVSGLLLLVGTLLIGIPERLGI